MALQRSRRNWQQGHMHIFIFFCWCCHQRRLHLHANNAPLIKRGHNYIFSPRSKNPLTFPDCLQAHQLSKKCASICFQATAAQPILDLFSFFAGWLEGWKGVFVCVCMCVKVAGVHRVCKLGHKKAWVTMATRAAHPIHPFRGLHGETRLFGSYQG